MSQKSFLLDASDILFRPLDKLKNKWDNSDLSTSVFRPLSKLEKKLEPHSRATYKHYNEDELINAESALGRTVFGPVPNGHQREFFRDSHNVWIFYEKWQENGIDKEIMIRYEVKKDGVYKRSGEKNFKKIEGKELDNFRLALRKYFELVKKNLYTE